MPGLTFAAVTATEKHTLMIDSTLNHDKVTGMQNLGQRHQMIMHT